MALDAKELRDKTPDQLREELKNSGRIEEIRMNLRTDKVKAFLRKKAKVTDERGPSNSEAQGGEPDGNSGGNEGTTPEPEARQAEETPKAEESP